MNPVSPTKRSRVDSGNMINFGSVDLKSILSAQKLRDLDETFERERIEKLRGRDL